MTNEKRFRITKLHICSFEKYDDRYLKKDLEKYPERLCIIDDQTNIVIDVETKHKYEYIKTINGLYFFSEFGSKVVPIGKRVGCFEYSYISIGNLSSDELRECKEIINLLKKGFSFPDGNEQLTNEQYLELINRPKLEEESKKMFKSRKKRK